MKLFLKIRTLILKLLRFAFKNDKRAQKKITEWMNKEPLIRRILKQTILEPLDIQVKSVLPNNWKNIKKLKFEIKKDEYNNWLKSYRNIINKEEKGLPLSTQEKKFKDFFDNILLDDISNDEVYYFNNSSYLVMLIYKKKSKTAIIKMKNSKMLYPFYKVPKTKVIKLLLENGKYMWDYFGNHYSANKKHWVRKGDK